MKKWLIVLSIVFAAGFVSSAVLAGRVYYQDLKVYTDYDKKELQVEALNNVYIKSSVPIEVYPTDGKPYVEFKQTFTDLIGSAPEYKLDIETKGDSTYINLDQIKDTLVWLGVKENKVQLSIYLPQSTINRLSIQDQYYYSYGSTRNEKRVINLEGINVNELSADMSYGEFILSGKYGKVNISARGKLNLDAKSPAEVYVDQSMDQYLTGQFNKISIKNNNGTDIIINSDSECQVDLSLVNNASVDLRGKYSRVRIDGDSNNLDLRSDSICKLVTSGSDNNIIANGPFNEMSFNEYDSSMEIQTTAIPNKINIDKASSNNKISLTLPSNIPGLIVKYSSQYYMDENQLEYYEGYGMASQDLQSDFELQEVAGAKEMTYSYGDGSIVIGFDMENNNSLQITDGGYSSVKAE